jgi:valyl-tRNA synthetase
LGLIDKYGADAVRFGIMIASPAGNDLLFDESSLEQGRNFNNKLWNALKLLKMWEERQDPKMPGTNKEDSYPATPAGSTDQLHSSLTTGNFAITWFESRLNEVKAEVDGLMQQFRLSEALKVIYSLIWDDFCSWYLEWIKPGFEQPVASNVYNNTIAFFDELLQLLHPYMPFITEEIYHLLKERKVNDDLCIKLAAVNRPPSAEVLEQGDLLKQVITAIRDAKIKNQVKPKDIIRLSIQTSDTKNYQVIEDILCKQINAAAISYSKEAVVNTIVVAVEKDKFYIQSERQLDTTTLKEDLLKDLEHQKSFLQSVLKKLSNERFVQNAKREVITLEQKKQADAEARIKTIEESLAGL